MKRCKQLTAVVGLVAVLGLAGCNFDADDYARLQQQAQTARQVADEAASRSADLDALIAGLPEGSTRDKLIAMKLQADKVLVEAQAASERFDAALADLEANPDLLSAIEAGTLAVAPILPPPWNLILVGLGGLIPGLLRSFQTKRAAKQIVRSVQPVMEKALKDPEVALAVKSEQGPTAERIVNEAQGKKLSLPV